MAAGDPAVSCGNNVLDVLHLLAKDVVKETATGKFYLRINLVAHTCDEIESAISCDNSVVSPEELLKNVFYIDECADNILTINLSYTASEG